MSHTLIDLSPDLKRLEDEGYEVEVRSGHLLLKHIPYVTENRNIERGTLVSELTLAGDVTTRPRTHVVMFAGGMPCDREGRPLTQIRHSSGRKELGGGLVVSHSFSSKPPGGYPEYYQKMTTYEAIISGPAQSIDPNVTSRTFAVIEAQDDGLSVQVHRYGVEPCRHRCHNWKVEGRCNSHRGAGRQRAHTYSTWWLRPR